MTLHFAILLLLMDFAFGALSGLSTRSASSNFSLYGYGPSIGGFPVFEWDG